MLKRIFVLFQFGIFALLACSCGNSSSIPATSRDVVVQNSQHTLLQSPFNGDGNWYLTQAFGAYYKESSVKIDGHHPGEDWNYQSGDGDAGQPVYPIAEGTIVGAGPVFNGDTTGSLGGFYIIVKHEGSFFIPASQGAHLYASSAPIHETARASNSGASMIYSKNVFTNDNLTDFNLGETDSEGEYHYPEMTVPVIYSVYMHIQDPKEYLSRLINNQITEEMLDEPIGYLMGGMENFKAHLHFEIRIGNNANITRSALPGNSNGYYSKSQDMISVGYREPSSIIQANMKDASASETISAPSSFEGASVMQSDQNDEVQTEVNMPQTGSPVNIEEESIYYDNEYVSVQITYPQLSGLLDKGLEEQINTNIVQEMHDAINSSEQVAEEENPDYPYSVEASYEVGRNDGAFLSMYLNVYCESGGAHGEEYTLYYNVLNTNPGVILSLSDLFIESSDYISVLNEKIRELIEKDPYLSEENYFTTITANQDFYLTDSEVIITFQKGDISAYIEDQPVFRVSLNEISDMVVPWLK